MTTTGSCLNDFPSRDPACSGDRDGDGVSVDDDPEDCNDFDPNVFPGADECSLLESEPRDHDCDGIADGGALPWRDDFDDGIVDPAWWQIPSAAIAVESDGVLEQIYNEYFYVVRAAGSPCWDDLDVRLRLIPGASVGELLCTLSLRVEEWGAGSDAPTRGYRYAVHHHSFDTDGVNPTTDWDGYFLPCLRRYRSSEDVEDLVGCGDQNPWNPALGLEASNDGYWFRLQVAETDAGTALTCEYATEDPDDGGGYTSCIPGAPARFVDEATDRPSFGGIAIGCSQYNFNEGADGPEGMRVDFVDIRWADSGEGE